MHRKMEVRDLQVFISVAKHLNYTRAGEEASHIGGLAVQANFSTEILACVVFIQGKIV